MNIIKFIKEKYGKFIEYKRDHLPFSPEDEDLLNDTKSALIGKPTFIPSLVLYVIVAIFVFGLIWAYFGVLDQSAMGLGKVIPITESKIIQSLDGGTIVKINVNEGDIVNPGQILMQLDTKRNISEYEADYEKYLALSAKIARLTAESQNLDHINFPAFVLKDKPQLAEREMALFKLRKENYAMEMANLEKIYSASQKEVSMYEPLLKEQYISQIQYLRAVRVAEQAQHDLLEKKNKFAESIWTELNQNKADAAVVYNNIQLLKDKIDDATIISPVYGIVKKLHVITIGGVIQPGMNIMEIVPLSDSLLIQVKIKPSDIGFIHVGQSANVKITAYDYSIYGNLKGKVTYVSPDAIEEKYPTGGATQDVSFYYVHVVTDKSYFGGGKHKLPIIPGMGATVQIQTGKKRVLDYLLKPLLKAKEEALQER